MATSMSKLLIFVLIIHFMMTVTGYTTIPGSFAYEFFESPADWGGQEWLSYIFNLSNALAGLGIGIVIVGTLWIKSDFIVMAGFTSALLGFGIPMYHLWDAMGTTFGSNVVAVLIVSPLAVLYVMTGLAWWRGHST